MNTPRWFAPAPERTQAVIVEISDGSEPKASYYALLVTSAMIACFGLVTNSTAVIIGAMLVSPLMTPIFGIATGMLRADAVLFGRALRAEFGGVALAVSASFLFGLLPFVTSGEATPEMIARTQPTLLDLLVAVFAGFAGAYALLDERVSPALPGVAIAVAIVPPLSTCGLCLASGAFDGAFGAFVLFFANFIAILLVALIMFSIAGMAPSRRWSSLGDFVRRFGVTVGGFIVIAVALTHSLVRIYWDRWTENTIEQVLTAQLARESVALEEVQHKHLDKNMYVMATVRSPEIVSPVRVAQIQEQLRTELGLPTQLVVRTIVAADVVALGSNISLDETNLNGVFFHTELSPGETNKRLARQVLLENLDERQGYKLTGLEYGQMPHGPIVLATIETIRPIHREDILAIEARLQERLGDPKLGLVVQYNRSTLVEREGRMLIEWTKHGDGEVDETEVAKLKELILTESRKIPSLIPLAVHFHVEQGVWRTLVEAVGPRPATPEELVQIQAAVSAQTARPVEVNLWHRADVVVTTAGYAAFEQFTRRSLEQRIESLPRIFGKVAAQSIGGE